MSLVQLIVPPSFELLGTHLQSGEKTSGEVLEMGQG
jgi:hypothetical protein